MFRASKADKAFRQAESATRKDKLAAERRLADERAFAARELRPLIDRAAKRIRTGASTDGLVPVTLQKSHYAHGKVRAGLFVSSYYDDITSDSYATYLLGDGTFCQQRYGSFTSACAAPSADDGMAYLTGVRKELEAYLRS